MKFLVTGGPAWKEALEQIRFDEKTQQAFGETLHELLIDDAVEQFDSLGAAGGTPWPGYDGEPKWRAYKREVLELDGDISWTQLRWPGGDERLMPSFTDKNHPEHVFVADGSHYKFGSSVPYAGRHQDGEGNNPFGEPIPKRPILVMTTRRVDSIRGSLAEHLNLGADVPGEYVS